MKRVSFLFYVIFLLISFVSCQQQKSDYINFVDESNRVYLTEDNLPKLEYFTTEKIDLPDSITEAHFMYVYADTLLVAVNDKNPSPYIISIYSLNSNKFISGYFKRGNGPNELISASVDLKDNYLYINDFSINAITRVNLDSAFSLGFTYFPKLTYIKDGYYGMNFYYENDSTIILVNSSFINGFGVEDIPEFVKINVSTGEPIEDYKRNEECAPYNICLRSLFFDKNKNQYIVPWHKFPVISIFDSNLNLIKQYIGPESCDIDLEIDEDTNIYEMNDKHTGYYASCCSFGNKMIMSNMRSYKHDFDDVIGFAKFQEIWIFDKQNGFEKRCKFKGTHGQFYSLSLDSKNNIYLMHSENDGLYKCVFE